MSNEEAKEIIRGFQQQIDRMKERLDNMERELQQLKLELRCK